MKVIIQSYPACCQNESGGVQNRIRKIASLLAERGVEVELFNSFSTKLHRGDILHVFMSTYENASFIQYAKAMGVKVVISTIIPLIDERKLRLYKALFRIPIVTTYKLNRFSLQRADALITESDEESAFINRYYSIHYEKMTVIPNGVDFDDYMGDDIYDQIGTREKYVLMVGRFDENKNQLSVIKAVKGQGIHLILIGGAQKNDDEYYLQCQKEAEGCLNIHFLGWISSGSKLLQSAYAHADTVILASYYETFGLTAIEGAAKGAKVIFSKNLPIRQYQAFRDCLSFNPSNIGEIRDIITKSISMPSNLQMRGIVHDEFNWNAVIDKHIALYKNL